MQQHLIAHNYPSILDGIVPERSFPDGQTLSHTNTDVALLNNYFPRATVTWTDAQKLAISGFGVLRTLTNAWAPISDRVSIYTRVCPNAIPVVQRYNAVTNPGGVRCTIWDSMANYYGKNPLTGFAYRAIDNVGVQYGLRALNDGAITVDQFLDLNQLIGGFDVDGNFIASRTVGDSRESRRVTGPDASLTGAECPFLYLIFGFTWTTRARLECPARGMSIRAFIPLKCGSASSMRTALQRIR